MTSVPVVDSSALDIAATTVRQASGKSSWA